ncbi:MAG TPA: methyltransferase domain-containing protein [Bryobacteraceae bacterium]|nr:methyltransferase domain-containing protein [Bryobacteraceae bacterium]
MRPPAAAAGDPLFAQLTRDQVARIEQDTWYHEIELPGGTRTKGLITHEALLRRFDSFGIPSDLRGKRVLDIGAATGWCSFECERRGAEVVAVDCVEYEDFRIAHKLLNSKASYEILDIEEMTPERLGLFDYVLFFGVLYHLRHPLLGLERVCSLTTETAFVESFVCDSHLAEPERSINSTYMEFYEVDQLGGQIDNWIGPTTNCLMALCRSAGFARVSFRHILDRRAGVVCHRQWDHRPAHPPVPAPSISSAVNNRTNDVYFHPLRDEYICIYFDAVPGLTLQDIMVEVDGLGAPLLTVHAHPNGAYQANVHKPPGLAHGPHRVCVASRGSHRSEPVQIFVGEPEPARVTPLANAHQLPAPDLFRIENSADGSVTFRGFRSEYLSCFFDSPAMGLTRDDVSVEVGPELLQPVLLTRRGHHWQANLRLPKLDPGKQAVRVRISDGPWSNSQTLYLSSELPPVH